MGNRKWRLIADYHTHTVYSQRHHGKGTIEENVRAACAKGLEEIGITDHGPGHMLYGIRPCLFQDIRKEIDALNEKYPQIKVLFGVEANVISYDGEIDLTPEQLAFLDFVNVGFHSGVFFKDFKSYILYFIINPLSKWISVLQPWVIRKNTLALIKIVEKYPIKIVTHPGDKVDVDVRLLAEVCKNKGTGLEINSSHGKLDEFQLQQLKGSGVTFFIGSDAHSPGRVGDVAEALKMMSRTDFIAEDIVNIKEVE